MATIITATGMTRLSARWCEVAALLKERNHTIGVAESSTGGLISAGLLAIPGASAYYLGGAIIYTARARRELLGIDPTALKQQEPLSAGYVALCADAVRARLRATWGLAEVGAAGPAGTPYGHPPGISVVAVSGLLTLTRRIETGSADREHNMRAFADGACDLLREALEQCG